MILPFRSLRVRVTAAAGLVSVGFGLLPVAAQAAVPEWPQWRGPTRDGVVSTASWPSKIDESSLRLAWSVPLGPSYSGPVTAGPLVFTTETVERKMESVRAFDRATGKEVWRQQWEGALSVPFFAKSNGDWIRSTPATDGERLYVAGMRDVLVCLSVTNGAVLWRLDFPSELKTPLPDFGFVCSPLVQGGAVYVQAGGSLAKVDALSGKVLWRSLSDGGGMMGSAFSSPILTTLHKREQIVAQTRETLAGVDPADGKVLWSQKIEAFRGMNILTPVVSGNRVFTSSYGGKTLGFDLTPSEGAWSVGQAWEMKSQGYMSTPVVIGGVAYHHLKSQRFAAIDLATGKELWTSSESFGKYMSLVANGDRILALDQNGTLYLIRANPERLEVMGKRRLGDAESWAHLAVAGDELFVRELNRLVSYRWSPGS